MASRMGENICKGQEFSFFKNKQITKGKNKIKAQSKTKQNKMSRQSK